MYEDTQRGILSLAVALWKNVLHMRLRIAVPSQYSNVNVLYGHEPAWALLL